MEQWYALGTASGREEAAVSLLKDKIDHKFWNECRILKKIKVFRTRGKLRLLEDVMFHGYILVNTDCPEKLIKELQKAKDFPQPLQAEEMIPLESADLSFLKSVCGEKLQKTMGITRILLNSDNKIIEADGVLDGYLNQIVKLNLHRRFAIVEVELFNRKQDVLFGVQLERDLVG